MAQLTSTSLPASRPVQSDGTMVAPLTWVHLGDLHITGADQPNYRDLSEIVAQANEHLVGEIDFAALPGDIAENGTEQQYRLPKLALGKLGAPVHILPGDHDMQQGSLSAFHAVLGGERLPKALSIAGYRCLFLDVVSAGKGGPDFRLGAEQLAWLEEQLRRGDEAS